MTSWSIPIPYTSRDESLLDVASNCRHIKDPEQRAAAREVLLASRIAGLESAGQLLDVLEDTPPDIRRVMLDGARKRAGCQALRTSKPKNASRTTGKRRERGRPPATRGKSARSPAAASTPSTAIPAPRHSQPSESGTAPSTGISPANATCSRVCGWRSSTAGSSTSTSRKPKRPAHRTSSEAATRCKQRATQPPKPRSPRNKPNRTPREAVRHELPPIFRDSV